MIIMDKLINICVTYYNQGEALQEHINIWKQYSPEVLKKLRFIIIDDGSKKNPASGNIKDHSGVDIALYNIEEDIPWNVGGARNLAFSVAKGKWLFQLDMDTLLEPPEAANLVKFAEEEAEEDSVYKFRQNHVDEISRDDTHPGLMLVTKDTFWKTDGHDEDFCGHYGGTDIHIFYKFKENIKNIEIDPETGNPWIVSDKVSVRRFLIGETYDLERNSRRNIRLCDERRIRSNWSTGILRFHWKKVL